MVGGRGETVRVQDLICGVAVTGGTARVGEKGTVERELARFGGGSGWVTEREAAVG